MSEDEDDNVKETMLKVVQPQVEGEAITGDNAIHEGYAVSVQKNVWTIQHVVTFDTWISVMVAAWNPSSVFVTNVQFAMKAKR